MLSECVTVGTDYCSTACQ